MSVRVMTKVWELDLPDSEKIVLLALADSANDEGHCWPGMRSLMKKCSKSDRTIQLAIQRLVEAGHLTRREVPGKGCNYTVHPRDGFGGEKSSGHPRGDFGAPPKPLRVNRNRTIIEPPNIAHAMPVGWEPLPFDEATVSAQTIAQWPPGEYDAQVEAFIAYHAKEGTKCKDWQASWKTWVLNTRKFGIGRNDNGQGSATQRGAAKALALVGAGRGSIGVAPRPA